MKQWLINKIDLKTLQEIDSTLEVIEVEAGKGLFNYKCFWNACQIQHESGGEVAMVMCMLGNHSSLHYVNRIDGLYVDNTLGYTASNYKYYLIRIVPSFEYKNIHAYFNDTLEYWNSKHLKWYHKLFGISRVC